MIWDTESLYDSHSHLFYKDFDIDRDEIVAVAKNEGVEYILDVGIDLETSLKAVANSQRYSGVVKAAVGIDPQVAIPTGDEYDPQFEDSASRQVQIYHLKEVLKDNLKDVAALGETGMDSYWPSLLQKEGKISAAQHQQSLDIQEELFISHLELAKEYDLPLTIHSRGIEAHCAKIIAPYAAQGVTGIFHSFTGDYETAKKVLDSGWGLGVNGIVTFKNSQNLQQVFCKILGKVPQNSEPDYFYSKGVFFETDAPYLAPQGHRGERNQPAYVRSIFEQFCLILG